VVSAARHKLAGLTAVAVSLLGVTACTDLDEASAAGITRDDLVSEMATQLAGAATLTYTATYQTAGGGTAHITQAQKPSRSAYAYPGGRLIVTPTATTRCSAARRTVTCTETAPSTATGTELTGTAVVSPDTVLAMLNTAALDSDVIAQQHDTTFAGHHATCLDLRHVDGTPAHEFSVCVTSEGALGSFTATIGGKQLDVALTAYSDKADETAFALPPKAKLIDNRPN
jgi:hypothetical protein